MKFGVSFFKKDSPKFISMCTWHKKISLLINWKEVIYNKVYSFTIFKHVEAINTFRHHDRLLKNFFDSIWIFCNCTNCTLIPTVSKLQLLDVTRSDRFSKKLKSTIFVIQLTNCSGSFPWEWPVVLCFLLSVLDILTSDKTIKACRELFVRVF
jgi:hypothetical protein